MIKPEYKNITGLCYCVNFQWFSLSKNVFPQLFNTVLKFLKQQRYLDNIWIEFYL